MLRFGFATQHPESPACLACQDGFFNADGVCQECAPSSTMYRASSEQRLTCAANRTAVIIEEGIKQCVSTSNIPRCQEADETRCTSYVVGFFVTSDFQCSPCTVPCRECLSASICRLCESSNVLTNEYQYANSRTISHCVDAKNNTCSQCGEGYKLNDKNPSVSSWGVNTALVFGVVLSVASVDFVCYQMFVIVAVFFYARSRRTRKNTTFRMTHSNVTFIGMAKSPTHVNKKVIQFNDDDKMLPVDQNALDLLCVGNGGSKTLKVQLGSLTSDKFTITIEPNVAVLHHGEAFEFSFTPRPICTTRLLFHCGCCTLKCTASRRNTSS